MTHMVDTNVIQFDKMQRRATIAKMTMGYSGMIARAMKKALLDDGEHVDPETGEPLVREMTRTETRHGAVVSIAEYLMAYIQARVRFEDPMKFYKNPENPQGLWQFHFEMRNRIQEYRKDNLGDSRLIVDTNLNEALIRTERDYYTNIFTALKIEGQNNPNLDEVQFWADIFRGFADGDSSGIVLRAAGLVLLDHLDAFSRALAYHQAK